MVLAARLDRPHQQLSIEVATAIGWAGSSSRVPLYLIFRRPGAVGTRHAVAVGQMLSSALLIHLSGGRLEMHFHIFGSLAFLAFYRDWRVLATASVVVAADQVLRGLYWPQSIFGAMAGVGTRGAGSNTPPGSCSRMCS